MAQTMARACCDQAKISTDILLATSVTSMIKPRLNQMLGFDVVSQGGSFLDQFVIWWLRKERKLPVGSADKTDILFCVAAKHFEQFINDWGLMPDIETALALCEAANSLREIGEKLEGETERWPFEVYQVEVDAYEAGAN